MDAIRIRSLLFVPGDSRRKLAKAAGIPADALIVDWEDAVAVTRKRRARVITQEAMAAFGAAGAAVLIRINSNCQDLIDRDCVAARECVPDAVVMPKCESAREVEAMLAEFPDPTGIFPLIESPAGVLHAASIAACSSRVEALIFGAEDYSAATRIIRTASDTELAFARSTVVNAARAAGKEVFDSPLMQYSDLAAVRDAAWRSRTLGFSGQAAIHPGQVPVINEVFSPSSEEIADAKAVLARFDEHGGGVYGVGGKLEDQPAVRNAHLLLERAR